MLSVTNMQPRDVDTKDRHAVQTEVAKIYRELFPGGSPQFVADAFKWIVDAFEGRFDGFQPIDAKYHDLEHTLQGTLAFARLLKGYSSARTRPELTRRAFELGLLAILLHDAGYLKEHSDSGGTGAKYTLVHVTRSAEFAKKLLSENGFSPAEVRAVQNMIRCTGVNTDLGSIPFHDDLERQVGFALGTADLLGQMAAPDYIEKLQTLYQEFEEANRYSAKKSGETFANADELRRKTPEFWEKYVLPKIENDFRGLYRFLAVASGSNPYIERIEANISRLRRELKATAA